MIIEVSELSKRVIRVSGVIDYGNAAELNRVFESAVRDCPRGIIVDLSQTTYMDSAGVQAVLHAYRLVTSGGGAMAMVLQNPNTRSIMRISGVDKLPGLHICDDLACAEEIVPECER